MAIVVIELSILSYVWSCLSTLIP